MIEHVIDHLAEHGIEEAVLSMGYRPDGSPRLPRRDLPTA